jgi:hypothetical protein
VETSRTATDGEEETNVRRVGVQGDERLDLELLLDHSILVGLLMKVPGDGLDDDLTRGGAGMSKRLVRIPDGRRGREAAHLLASDHTRAEEESEKEVGDEGEVGGVALRVAVVRSFGDEGEERQP